MSTSEHERSGALVITSINPPTETVVKSRELRPDWDIIVVGDGKSPDDWSHEGVTFLSLDDQLALPFTLAQVLPVGHYSRKNVGYLAAIANGVDILAETDDDNFPYDTFLADLAPEVQGRLVDRPGWLNVYRYFTEANIWPRGLPLNEVAPSRTSMPEPGPLATYASPVQQFLADGDPDVDAVYRLVIGEDVLFDRDPVIVLPSGVHCPFNSQNTVWYPEAFPLLYLPSTVSFRMTDIWRSFVTARCLGAAGQYLSFAGPTVYQERNEHDLHRDFVGEVDGYLNNDAIIQTLAALDLSGTDHGADLRACYVALLGMGMVDAAEIDLVDAWLHDLAVIQA